MGGQRLSIGDEVEETYIQKIMQHILPEELTQGKTSMFTANAKDSTADSIISADAGNMDAGRRSSNSHGKLDPDLALMGDDAMQSVNKASKRLGPEGMRAAQVSNIVGNEQRRSSAEFERRRSEQKESGAAIDHAVNLQRRASSQKAMEQQGVAFVEDEKDAPAGIGTRTTAAATATVCCVVS